MKGGCPLSQRARGHNCTLLELNSAEQTIECRLWVGGNMRDFSVGNGWFWGSFFIDFKVNPHPDPPRVGAGGNMRDFCLEMG